jgi:hypothetical protein
MYTADDVRTWFGLIDLDGDGTIAKDELFLFALCAASRRAGAGLEAIFSRYDSDMSGKLDELEFSRALEDMGCAATDREIRPRVLRPHTICKCVWPHTARWCTQIRRCGATAVGAAQARSQGARAHVVC